MAKLNSPKNSNLMTENFRISRPNAYQSGYEKGEENAIFPA